MRARKAASALPPENLANADADCYQQSTPARPLTDITSQAVVDHDAIATLTFVMSF
ncbi:MAG: hypothetical protein WBA01_04960 [Phormidesmis sp.]